MLEDIKRFITIVDSKSLSRAARLLHLTQPAVSVSLKRLEAQTHTVLISRSGKQLFITPDGQSVYRIGKRILELWETAKNTATRNTSEIHFTIGLFDNAALKLASFFKTHLKDTAYRIEIKIDYSTNLLHELNENILDMCICVMDSHTAIPKNSWLLKQYSETLLPVSAHTYTTTQISSLPFILYRKGSVTRTCIDTVFFKNSIQPCVVAESTSTSFMKELALNGSGIALLPDTVIREEIRNKRLLVQPLPFTFSRQCGMFLRKESQIKKDHPLVQEIITSIIS